MPLKFPASSRLPALGNKTILHFIHCNGISCRVGILLENVSMMSSKLPYFRISGAITSGSAALPSIRFSFTLLYSLFVKGPVCIAMILSRIVLICMELVSCSCPSPSSFLNHLITRSSLLLAFIFPLFGFLRPVTLLINFQISACLLCSLVCSICLMLEFRISAYMVTYSSCRSFLVLDNFSCKSFVLRREYSLYAA